MADTVLITGSSGLVGRILWNGLAGSFEMFGLDRASPASAGNVFQADVTQADQVERVFERIQGLRYVIHLAGDARVDADWQSAFHVNIGGTQNVYAAAQRHSVQRVIFASSNHATGAYEGIPPTLHTRDNVRLITTQNPIRPDGFYGVSKAAGEAVARMYYELYGLESICLRIGSVNRADSPAGNPRLQSTWLSHRDLVQLVQRALLADVPFGIYYGVSDNRRRFWDISDAERDLDYHPRDDASMYGGDTLQG
ncbi:MAG TPA: NAD(P)-dependent oxidoreductase [Anaerolineales bacterium]|nr:NAD(P)-dependent oxidoreductase [Anaerolineales bacterium]